jgi:hypothetical protein
MPTRCEEDFDDPRDGRVLDSEESLGAVKNGVEGKPCIIQEEGADQDHAERQHEIE